MSNRPNTGHVMSRLGDIDSRLTQNLTEVLTNLDTLQNTVDSILLSDSNKEAFSMATPTPTPTPIDLSQIQALLQGAGQQAPAPQFNIADEVSKALDAKMDSVVNAVMAAQEENQSFWTSPVFLGCLAGGILLVIGGTLYYMNQRVTALEEINVK